MSKTTKYSVGDFILIFGVIWKIVDIHTDLSTVYYYYTLFGLDGKVITELTRYIDKYSSLLSNEEKAQYL